MMYHQCHCSWCGFFTVQFLLRHLVRLFEGTAVSSNNGGNWRDSTGEKIPLEIKIDRRVQAKRMASRDKHKVIASRHSRHFQGDTPAGTVYNQVNFSSLICISTKSYTYIPNQFSRFVIVIKVQVTKTTLGYSWCDQFKTEESSKDQASFSFS